MNFAQVTTTIWLKHGAKALRSVKFVQTRDFRLMPDASLRLGLTTTVSVDNLMAGIGEKVMVCTGSRPRDVVLGPDVATKKTIIGIIDDFHYEPDHFPEPLLTGED